ncbi:hypothetical protein SeMB42_g04227 [Synchytrium endobioticum]|uniref:Uncharacterized protein n=1 Tax=Synchytrium endobioticum TaxID=286115 RepID=A0A507D041_9FUNG|nr:hypothetical protein SeMB42_g04227 [Synchytrium endobioticum]
MNALAAAKAKLNKPQKSPSPATSSAPVLPAQQQVPSTSSSIAPVINSNNPTKLETVAQPTHPRPQRLQNQMKEASVPLGTMATLPLVGPVFHHQTNVKSADPISLKSLETKSSIKTIVTSPSPPSDPPAATATTTTTSPVHVAQTPTAATSATVDHDEEALLQMIEQKDVEVKKLLAEVTVIKQQHRIKVAQHNEAIKARSDLKQQLKSLRKDAKIKDVKVGASLAVSLSSSTIPPRKPAVRDTIRSNPSTLNDVTPATVQPMEIDEPAPATTKRTLDELEDAESAAKRTKTTCTSDFPSLAQTTNINHTDTAKNLNDMDLDRHQSIAQLKNYIQPKSNPGRLVVNPKSTSTLFNPNRPLATVIDPETSLDRVTPSISTPASVIPSTIIAPPPPKGHVQPVTPADSAFRMSMTPPPPLSLPSTFQASRLLTLNASPQSTASSRPTTPPPPGIPVASTLLITSNSSATKLPTSPVPAGLIKEASTAKSNNSIVETTHVDQTLEAAAKLREQLLKDQERKRLAKTQLSGPPLSTTSSTTAVVEVNKVNDKSDKTSNNFTSNSTTTATDRIPQRYSLSSQQMDERLRSEQVRIVNSSNGPLTAPGMSAAKGKVPGKPAMGTTSNSSGALVTYSNPPMVRAQLLAALASRANLSTGLQQQQQHSHPHHRQVPPVGAHQHIRSHAVPPQAISMMPPPHVVGMMPVPMYAPYPTMPMMNMGAPWFQPCPTWPGGPPTSLDGRPANPEWRPPRR